jgi:hypothetical protein
MAEYKFKKLTRFAMKPLGEHDGLAFRLTFRSEKNREDTIQFHLSPKHTMICLHALKEMQEKFDWTMPKVSPTASKKPALRVVVDNDEKTD